MFSTGYGGNSYTGNSPARQMTPARNSHSGGSGGTFNSVINGVVKAVAEIGIQDLLGSIFN